MWQVKVLMWQLGVAGLGFGDHFGVAGLGFGVQVWGLRPTF